MASEFLYGAESTIGLFQSEDVRSLQIRATRLDGCNRLIVGAADKASQVHHRSIFSLRTSEAFAKFAPHAWTAVAD